MICRACGYSNETRAGDDHLDHSKSFIELGPVTSIREIPGVSGHPRLGNGLLHGQTLLFAGPVCGTVRVEVTP